MIQYEATNGQSQNIEHMTLEQDDHITLSYPLLNRRDDLQHFCESLSRLHLLALPPLPVAIYIYSL